MQYGEALSYDSVAMEYERFLEWLEKEGIEEDSACAKDIHADFECLEDEIC